MEKSLDLCTRSTFEIRKCARRTRRSRHLLDDCISSLPDDILIIILSLSSLAFDELIKTSFLSRRWLNLWVHTTVLNFQESLPKVLKINHNARKIFVKWVNGALQRHKGEFLREFKIVCDLDKCNQEDINRWLKFALARKVEHLEFNLLLAQCIPNNLSYNYVFPGHLLNPCSGKVDSDVSMSRLIKFDLKCLKSLSLKSVDVTDKDVNFLLLNCPFLERLEVVGSLKLVNLVISDPTLVLKYLCIMYCLELKVLSISNFNLVSLDISSVGDLTLGSLPSLVGLSIFGYRIRLHLSFSQISCYSQLESLHLHGDLKNLYKMPNFYRLTNLKRLVISGEAVDDGSLTLLSIISVLPQLEEFVLMLCGSKFERNMAIRDVPRGRSSSSKSQTLKVFEFFGYYGRALDVKFIMHVVEDAVGLEKVVIDPRVMVFNFPCLPQNINKERKARRVALKQFDFLRKAIPSHVQLLIR